jgi:hypothetical protein
MPSPSEAWRDTYDAWKLASPYEEQDDLDDDEEHSPECFRHRCAPDCPTRLFLQQEAERRRREIEALPKDENDDIQF